MSRTKVFLVSSGLGHVARGYESFTEECFRALRFDDTLDLHLFRGEGERLEGEIALHPLRRRAAFTRAFSHLIQKSPYYIEQVSFGLKLWPYVAQESPDVILFSDGTLGNFLWQIRYWRNYQYRLLFSNGGPLDPPFNRWDLVHEVAPVHYENAIRSGESPDKLIMLPYATNCPGTFAPLLPEDRRALRHAIGLPEDRIILLSVGALSADHKRMDYLINEVAQLPEPRPFLLLLGQPKPDTKAIESLARRTLGENNFLIRTVVPEGVADFYRASDIFALASLHEGLARVLLEASVHGLPCIVHDYEVPRFVLGDLGYYGDFTTAGSLARIVHSLCLASNTPQAQAARHRMISEQFSWDILRPRYVKMLHDAASRVIPPPRSFREPTCPA